MLRQLAQLLGVLDGCISLGQYRNTRDSILKKLMSVANVLLLYPILGFLVH